MIDSTQDRGDIWSKLAREFDPVQVAWRQDGKPQQGRDQKHYARYVAYVEANDVRERLDSVVPGEWDLTLELLPPQAEGEVSFKARLQILGVIREDVGTGKDYKSAATDAFKRAGTRFGIAHELYSFENNWVPVEVSQDGRRVKPLEDPAAAYFKRFGTDAQRASLQQATGVDAGFSGKAVAQPDGAYADSTPPASGVAVPPAQSSAPSGNGEGTPAAAPADEPACPKCGGRMWDNRATKRNPKAPDFKCRDRSCEGVIWPSKGKARAAETTQRLAEGRPVGDASMALVPALQDKDDDLPF